MNEFSVKIHICLGFFLSYLLISCDISVKCLCVVHRERENDIYYLNITCRT